VPSLTLAPGGRVLSLPAGASLREALFTLGVEFPCGGHGRCRGCRVRVLAGQLPVQPAEGQVLTPDEQAQGWRLACQHRLAGDLQLELPPWEMPVLGDDRSFAFRPGAGFGIAVDLGTTTLAAQLLDLHSGQVLAVRSALNAQARFGADVMSRLEYALRGGQAELQALIRAQVGGLVADLLRQAQVAAPARVVLVGNTAMHHLFGALDCAPLARHPFTPIRTGRLDFEARELGWPLTAPVAFLPCIGGFVGADVLAGVAATGMARRAELTALIDLGTNGEIVVGNRDRLLATSTAAGPAFEGARISCGMRAATGAICAVRSTGGALDCRVIGGGPARGLCGSGLVDAIAAGLELGRIAPGGRLAGASLPLRDGVALSQADVREFQLAKGAIAAGLRLLTARLGTGPEDLAQVHLAGAFGNYVQVPSACRVGLLEVPPDRVTPAGNTALLGAKLALFQDPERWDRAAASIEAVALNLEPAFQEAYVEAMGFPEIA